MIVIDASAMLEMLSGSEKGLSLETALEGVELHAPHLLDLEVASALRRWEGAGIFQPGEGAKILGLFLEMPITRYPHTNLLGEIWALRHNLTACDGAYLALARFLDAELLTMDDGLRKRAKRR
jgi:predicted nucleic acid-binding protein